MRKMTRTRVASLFLLTLPLLSCASPNLFVVDENGSPVEGATVRGTWPSVDQPVATTDRSGAAHVDVSSGSLRPAMDSMTIRKPGFQSVTVDAQQSQPLHVVLRRVGP